MTDETAPRRRRRPLVVVVAIVVVVLLAGGALIAVIGLGGDAPAASPSAAPPGAAASESPRPADPALVPVYPDEFTVESAGLETTRLGDAIIARIDPAAVVNDDAFAQEVPPTGSEPGYFGVLHTLTLDPTVPPAALVDEIVTRLGEAGWTEQDTAQQQGYTQVVLVSGSDSATSWFALIGADASVPGQSVVSVQLASPNLP